MTLDEASWGLCKRETLLRACVSECTALGRVYPELCIARNASLTLSVLWCSQAVLLLTAGCAYFTARHILKNSTHRAIDKPQLAAMLSDMKRHWNQALKWKPWGLKFAALIGLGVFWFDKATDIKLILDVRGTWTAAVLLVLFFVSYLIHGYVLLYRVANAHGFRHFLQKSCFRKVVYAVFAAFPLTPVLLTVTFDALLFVSDLGFNVPFVGQHADFEEYQPFRDAGRSVFGTLPTVVLQSVVFTVRSTPDNGLVLTTEVFVIAFVAAGLQLLKVTGQTVYFALRDRKGLLRVWWQLLAGTEVIKEPIARKGSDLLPDQQPSSSQQDAA